VATTPKTLAGSLSPEQKERTTSAVFKDVSPPPPVSIAMTKSDSSSELTEETRINEATILFNESDTASIEVDLLLPEVENLKVEEEASNEDLVAIDEVSNVKQEVDLPLPEVENLTVGEEASSEDLVAIDDVISVKQEVDLPLPEVESLTVEEEASSEDLVAIDEVISAKQEVQPLPESTDVPSVLTEALESPKDETVVEFGVTSEDFAAIDEVTTKKEVQHQLDTKDTLSVLTITETVESPKYEKVVGEASEVSESVVEPDSTMLVTNKTEKFSIFDVYEADNNRENSTSPSITIEDEVQVPQTNQNLTSLSANDGFPLELAQTAKFAVFDVKA